MKNRCSLFSETDTFIDCDPLYAKRKADQFTDMDSCLVNIDPFCKLGFKNKLLW